MNRVAVFIVLTILLAACAQSVVTFPVAAPGPTTSPVISPTPAAPSATAVPFSTATGTATPSCLPIRIMPLGDSITYGEGVVSYGGYRNLLGALLESEGVQFDYVGSRKSGTESLADPDNEGHPGWTISKLHEELVSEGWLETYRPDIILLHIGTNDFPHAVAAGGITAGGITVNVPSAISASTNFPDFSVTNFGATVFGLRLGAPAPASPRATL